MKTQNSSSAHREQELQNLLHQTILRTAMDGFWMVDLKGRLLEINEAYCRMSGYTEEELLNMRVSDLDASDSPDDFSQHIETVIRLGSQRFETRHRRKDGTLYEVEISVQYQPESDGRLVAFLRDITERRLAEERLRENQELFAQFMLHSPVYAYIKKVTATESRVIQASENYIDMVGIPGSAMRDKSMHELFPAEFADKMTADDYSVVQNGVVLHLPEEFNGRYYTTIKFPIGLRGDTLLAGYTIDITDQKLAEIALQEKEKLLLESQAVANLGTYVWDIPSGMWVGSQVLDRIFGIDESYVRSLAGWAAIIHPDWREAMNEYLVDEVVGKRQFFDREYKIIHQSSGQERWVHGLGRLEFDDFDQPIRLIGTISDITARKLEEQELLHAKEHAERMGKLKDAFIANISHEIRTPLNSILGFSTIIEERCKTELDETEQGYFDHVRFAAQRLMRTVDLILVLSRIQAGDIQQQPQRFDLPSQLGKLVESFGLAAGQKGLEISFLNDIGDISVTSDQYCLTEAISNLLHNAIKFTEHGAVTVRLEKSPDARTILSISDTGIGISEEYSPYLFEPYSQEEIGYSRRFEGIGLGMTLVKKYLDLLALPISFQSSKGEGTVFSIDLSSVISNAPQCETETLLP
ncbi:MAG: PAS domain S-box protein [Bacteroidetes bacterium]|nr:PAS domain S-box protein [Bacteroidota bacterium]